MALYQAGEQQSLHMAGGAMRLVMVRKRILSLRTSLKRDSA